MLESWIATDHFLANGTFVDGFALKNRYRKLLAKMKTCPVYHFSKQIITLYLSFLSPPQEERLCKKQYKTDKEGQTALWIRQHFLSPGLNLT